MKYSDNIFNDDDVDNDNDDIFGIDCFKDLVTIPSLLHSSDRSVNVFGINLRNTT